MSGRSQAERDAREKIVASDDAEVPVGSAQLRQRDDNYYVVRVPATLVDDCGLSHGDRLEQTFDPTTDELRTLLDE